MNALALVCTLTVVVSCVLLLVLPPASGRSRGGGADERVHDLSEAAFLGGGPARTVDTALTALYADGRLVVGGPGIVAVRRAEARDVVERAVLQEAAAAPSGALRPLREAAMRHPAVQEIGDGLAARGLLAPPGGNRARRRWALTQGVGCVVGFPVSIGLTVTQYALHEGYDDVPFPFVVKVLPALVLGAVVGLVVAASARARLTRAGRRAADAYRAAHAQVAHPAHLVATRGLAALPYPELREQLLAAARHNSPGRTGGMVTSAGVGAGAYAGASGPQPVWCAGPLPAAGVAAAAVTRDPGPRAVRAAGTEEGRAAAGAQAAGADRAAAAGAGAAAAARDGGISAIHDHV
ncbi:TIGR04222 domain-containing membrane protein [Streptomyces sp. NTK 937]|uniref:TIGR04222 domain-containing membrane protein n=1 Tax=Streptomyces sp. NTK 937 TaxID=1487711 RepID=UPI000A869B94